jgi:hypothetical protein
MSDQEDALPAEVDRVWHALKRRGWHPGRTDDTLSACVRAVIDAAPIGPYNRGVDAVIKRQEDALPALPEPYWPGFRPSLDSRVDLFTADQMHSYARAALAARDADLARYRSMYQGMATEAARLKFLALTGQSDAARDDARDAERLEWLMHRITGKELRRIGIITSGAANMWRDAIDAAIDSARGKA